MRAEIVQLKNVSSLPLTANISLSKPFQLQFTEQDEQICTTSEQVFFYSLLSKIFETRFLLTFSGIC